MKYIREISLRNFQSHKNTVLKFENKLNIIVGPSDSGKTAILRAIKWVLYNEPLGDYFIREGESSSSVTIELNNGVKVERYRDKSKNQYHIYRGEEKETYEGFGSGVPLEVSQAIGIEKLELDQKESRTINLAEQLEGAFLISEKASVKASSIGRLVGANIIDDALKESLKDSRNISIKTNGLSENNQEIIKELEAFKYLDQREKNLDSLEKLSQKIEELESKQVQLDILEKNYSVVLLDKKDKSLVLESLEFLELAQETVARLDLLIEKHLRLEKLGLKLLSTREDLARQRSFLENTRWLEALEEELLSLDRLLKNKAHLFKLEEKLRGLRTGSLELKEKLARLGELNQLDLEDLEEDLVRLRDLSKLKEAYSSNRSSLTRGREYLAKLGDLGLVEDDLDLIDRKRDLKGRLEGLARAYEENQKASHLGREFLREKNQLIKRTLGQYKLSLEEAKTCPLCLSSLDSKHIDEVIVKFMEETRDE